MGKPRLVRRRRRSEAEREELLEVYRRSGKTQREFALAAGITVPTLAAWLRKSRDGASGAAGAGKLIEVSMPAAGAAPITIILRGDVVVRVGVGAPVAWVCRIIGQLRCGV